MRFKIVFAGTPTFAIPSLQALILEHEVCAVYTKPDTPGGRGLKLKYNPVKQFVLDHYPDLPILQPANLKDADTQRQLAEFYADIMVVIAYGLILPVNIFPFFPYGCINAHASLLPRWRGAAPIQRCLLAGDTHTGVTIMQIDQGLDTGKMLSHQSYAIQPLDTAQTLHDHLAQLSAQSLIKTLSVIAANETQPIVQDNTQATYAVKMTKEEALINWHDSATRIERQIRAFNPWPVAYTYLHGQMLKVWQAVLVSKHPSGPLSGTIIQANGDGMEVVTGQGTIRLLKVQLPGGKPLLVKDFLNARRDQIIPGKTRLGG